MPRPSPAGKAGHARPVEPLMPTDSTSSDPSAGKKPEAEPKRKRGNVGKGVAMGIGSAALVAALLYANRSKKGDRG